MEERFEKHIDFLVDRIDPDFGLLDKLLASKILTREAVHKIKLKVNTTEDKNRILLDFILKNNKMNDLVLSLRDSGQTHLVNYLNADGGYKFAFGDDWPLSESDISQLDINRERLIDLLETSDLCNRLFSEKVINNRQKQFVFSKPTDAERNEALLDIMTKFSDRQYKKTIECLHHSKQSHIAALLSEGGVLVRVHANSEGAIGNVDELEDEIIARFTKDLENYPLDEATRLLERTQLRLRIVAAKKGQSIVIYIHCVTHDDLLQLNDLLKADRLKGIIERIFNKLLSIGDALGFTLTWSLEEFRRAAKYFELLQKRLSKQKRILDKTEVTETKPQEIEDSESVSLSGDLQSKLKVTERPSLSTAFVEESRHGGWLRESLFRPKPLDKICACDATTQTDEEKKTTSWIFLLFTFLSVLCCPVIQASSDYVVGRGAYGVYFHYKGLLEVGTDVWIHTFDIALPVVKSLPPSQIKTALNCQFRNTPLNGLVRGNTLDKPRGRDATTQTDEQWSKKKFTEWPQINPTVGRPDEQGLYSSAYADVSRERKLRNIIEYTYDLFPSEQADKVMEHIYENIGGDLFLAPENLKVEGKVLEKTKEKQEPRYTRTPGKFIAVPKQEQPKLPFELTNDRKREELLKPYDTYQYEIIKQKQDRHQRARPSWEPIGLELQYKSDPVLVKMITTKAAEEKQKAIYGLTILDKELFIVTRMTSEVEVYDTMNLSLSGQWILKDLMYPKDIGSCNRNKCLYVFDYKGSGQSKVIMRVHPDGKLINEWSIGDDDGYYWGGGLSVTEKGNVILTVFSKNKLQEYSPDGRLIREINMSTHAGIRSLWYATELTNRHYVVSHGYGDDELHRVCVVDADGKLKKSFGGKCGSTIGQTDIPVYLAIDGNGFVVVADLENNRVLILDSDLKFNREVLLKEEPRLRHPLRVLLDESNGRIFVADNGWDSRKQIYNDGRILILDFK